MQFKKFTASMLSVFLLLSLFANVPLAFGAINEPTLLKDINLATEDSDPEDFVQMGNYLYYTLDEYDYPLKRKIYFSNLLDLEAGAQILGENVDYMYPDELIYSPSLDKLFFSAYSEEFGSEVWSYDGESIDMITNLDYDSESEPDNLLAFGDYIYFSAEEEETGREFYISDGTTEGTVMVDVAVGPESSDPQEIVEINDSVYFTAEVFEDGDYDVQSIYKVNDTFDGVDKIFSLDPDLIYSGYAYFEYLTEFNNELYFIGRSEDGDSDRVVYRSDGLVGGVTERPFEFTSGGNVEEIHEAGDKLYIVSNGGLVYLNNEESPVSYNTDLNEQLWYYDPSVDGPKFEVSDSWPDYAATIGDLNIDGEPRPELVTVLNDGDAVEFYDSDYDDNEVYMYEFDNKLIFVAYEDNFDYGGEPYITDGTEEGTFLLKDLNDDNDGSDVEDFVILDGMLFFDGDAPEDQDSDDILWMSDGTTEGTTPVLDQDDNFIEPDYLYAGADALYFSSDSNRAIDDEPYMVKETEGGWILTNLADVNQYTYGLNNCECDRVKFYEYEGLAYFVASDIEHGREFWVTDGTTEGTELLLDSIEGEESPYPEDIVIVNDILYFNGYVENERNLYYIDLNDLNSGMHLIDDGDLDLDGIDNFVVAGTTIFFQGYEENYGYELWKIDTVEDPFSAEMLEIVDGSDYAYPEYITAFGDSVYFRASHPDYASELWKSDGTLEGTVLVKDINEGLDDWDNVLSSSPSNLYVFKDEIYFAAETASSGNELWKTDGTTEGTVQVADIATEDYEWGPDSSSPSSFSTFGNLLFFSATTQSTGEELYVTTGEVDNFTFLGDLNPGSSSVYPESLTALNDYIVFAGYDNDLGYALYRTDGTLEGTVLVKDIEEEGTNNELGDFVDAGDYAYFTADDGIVGDELWITDGTEDGTLLVDNIFEEDLDIDDVNYESYDSDPYSFEIFGDNKLLFVARNNETDSEPYVMDINQVIEEDSEEVEEEMPSSGSSSGSRVGGGGGGEKTETSSGTAYEQEVAEVLAEKVVTENPDFSTNKCEALVMMARVFKWEVGTDSNDVYTDTPEWCGAYARFGTERGIVEGRTPTTLGMETPVTRYEIAVMLYRELKIRNYKFEGKKEVTFSDELIPWAKEAVEALAKEGIINGFADGTFGGTKGILKQDAAIMIFRFIKKENNYKVVEDSSSIDQKI